jgi:hypothetical protein
VNSRASRCTHRAGGRGGHWSTGRGARPTEGASPKPALVQTTVLNTDSKVTCASVDLSGAVSPGDLLVGWFATDDASGLVRVSDNINGPWTRARASIPFHNDPGGVALYYLANTKEAPGGVTVTVSAAESTLLSAGIAEYAGGAPTIPEHQHPSERRRAPRRPRPWGPVSWSSRQW